MNHIDSQICSSEEIKHKILEILKIVNQSYKILSDKNRMAKYRREKSQQESLKVVAFKELESEFQALILGQKNDEIKKLIRKMSAIVEILPALKTKMDLYKMCFMMKENNYLITEEVIVEFSSKLVNESHHEDMKELYFYVRGCLEICKGDLQSAQSLFQKSIEQNSKFSLANFELVNLKNKSAKGFSIFKKSS